MGDEGSLPYVLVLAAQVECVRGDLSAAARRADQGYALTEQTGQATIGAYLLECGRWRTPSPETNDKPERMRASPSRSPTAPAASGRTLRPASLGLLELLSGGPGRQQGAGAVGGVPPPGEDHRPGHRPRGPGPDRGTHSRRRTRCSRRPARLVRGNALRLQRHSAIAAGARCRGLLAGARGDVDGALAELERGLALHRGVPIPLERGRTELALGDAPARETQARAREALESSVATLREWAPWSRTARPRGARTRGGRAPSSGELTSTERRVAEVVAQGCRPSRWPPRCSSPEDSRRPSHARSTASSGALQNRALAQAG